MTRSARLILPLALVSVLSACHTDPFSVKPEVRGVEVPEKPADPAEPAAPETKTPESKP